MQVHMFFEIVQDIGQSFGKNCKRGERKMRDSNNK